MAALGRLPTFSQVLEIQLSEGLLTAISGHYPEMKNHPEGWFIKRRLPGFAPKKWT
jgi:hypothetical protein